MEETIVKVMDLRDIVDKAITLDAQIKANTKELDKIKAVLQAEALREIENKNVKYIEFFGSKGSSNVGFKEKLEITNYDKLCNLIGAIVGDHVKREQSVKLTPDSGFKAAMSSLYKNDIEQCDIDKILTDLGLDDKERKAAQKKLKGDYWKDRAVLESFGCKGKLEEELDAIRRQKNYENVEKYLDLNQLDEEALKAFKTTMSLEESLSIGLDYAVN